MENAVLGSIAQGPISLNLNFECFERSAGNNCREMTIVLSYSVNSRQRNYD